MAKWKQNPFTASSFNFRFHENLPLSLLPLPASASTFLVTTLPNAAFYPRKTSKRLKLPGLCLIFCQISIVRQHTKYKDYKTIQKYEDVNISVYRCSQQKWSPWGRSWPWGRPRGHILKSLASASRPQVLEICPVLGSRTALFLNRLTENLQRSFFWLPQVEIAWKKIFEDLFLLKKNFEDLFFWDRLKKFRRPFFFLENTCVCVLSPWPWPREGLSLALASKFFCVLGLEPCVLVARLLSATATCNLTTVMLTQYVAYVLIRFLCNTGSREWSMYFSILTPTPDVGKILFSTTNPGKNLRLPQLRLSTPTLQHCCRLCVYLLLERDEALSAALWCAPRTAESVSSRSSKK